MRFIFKEFPNYSESFTNDKDFINAFKILPEKRIKILLFILSCSTTLFCFTLGYNLLSFKDLFLNELLNFILIFFSSFIVLIPLHLILHTLFYDGGCIGNKTFIGFNIDYLEPYNSYKGMIGYHKFLIMTIFPFLIMSFLPMLVLLLTGFNTLLYAVISANLILSTSDFLDFYIIIKFIPKKSYIIKSSTSLYYGNNNILITSDKAEILNLDISSQKSMKIKVKSTIKKKKSKKKKRKK